MADLRFQSLLGPRVVIDGRERDYFSGTGYLGLHNHPAVRQAAVDCIQQWGMATGTSRGGFGEHPVYDALESAARAFFDAERVLYSPSGYLSGLLLTGGLRGRIERVFIDAWSHFSLWDAARAAGFTPVVFEHLDAQSLADALARELRPGERPMVLSDGLFPISGEIAPARSYLSALAGYSGGLLALDDAHGFGCLGPNGRGTLDHHGLNGAPGCLAGGTLSKALGGYGGVLPGPADLLAEIETHARVGVGASPPPLPAAAAAAKALEIALAEPQRRRALWENVARVRAGLRGLGWEVEDSPAPIVCLRARAGVELGRIKDELFARGVCIAHVRTYSSTPPGGALRIAVFADHSAEQIERLVEGFRAVG